VELVVDSKRLLDPGLPEAAALERQREFVKVEFVVGQAAPRPLLFRLVRRKVNRLDRFRDPGQCAPAPELLGQCFRNRTRVFLHRFVDQASQRLAAESRDRLVRRHQACRVNGLVVVAADDLEFVRPDLQSSGIVDLSGDDDLVALLEHGIEMTAAEPHGVDPPVPSSSVSSKIWRRRRGVRIVREESTLPWSCSLTCPVTAVAISLRVRRS
jgi:hypothetical protein